MRAIILFASVNSHVPTCANPRPSKKRICLGVDSPASRRFCNLSMINAAFPAFSISSAKIPNFSNASFCFLLTGAISHPNEGVYPVKSSAWILISNCNGSTSFRLRVFISSSCAFSASSLCACTSEDASFSASSMSSGQPLSARFSVIFLTTSLFVQIMSAGLQSSCRSDSHRKSRISRSSLPGESLVPLPTIWQ